MIEKSCGARQEQSPKASQQVWKKLNFLFPIWGQDTAVSENKKADGKGWSSNKELCPTSRRESLKYTRHHTNGWHCTIMCSAMKRGCLSSNTSYLTTPYSGSSSATRNIEHQQKTCLYKQFIASSSMQSHTPVCFIPARDVWDPWRAFGIRSTHLAHLLAAGACIIHTGQCQQKLFLFLYMADKDWAQLMSLGAGFMHTVHWNQKYITWMILRLTFWREKGGEEKIPKVFAVNLITPTFTLILCDSMSIRWKYC